MGKKIWLVLIGVLIIAAGVWFFSATPKAVPAGPVTKPVSTTAGQVRGFNLDGLNTYLGIPYAENPSGSMRFKPPAARKPWQGVYDAYDFGPFCPQGYDPIVIENPKEDLNNEDCLTLNVWSPSASAEKRAVMVYIHGGGFVGGSSKENLYHAESIAKDGNVVVVTLNYRVGLLGFFDFSAIGGPEYKGSADAGIQDQLLALRWVKDNIASFGGDPENITIFGESAGGASVLALLGVENPKDYFKRVIVMSGSPLHSAQNSSDIANLLKKQTGISWAAAWKYAPAAAVMYIQKMVLDAVGSPLSDLIFAPTYGGDYVVKYNPVDAVKSGNAKGIDLMLGTMADEMSYWSFYDTPTSHVCEMTIKENLFTSINPAVETNVKALSEIYLANPQRKWKAEGDIILAIADDYAFRAPAIQLASEQAKTGKAFYYRVEYPVNLPDQPCQFNRSPHGSELPFLFGKINVQTGYNWIGKPRDDKDAAARQQLMDQMISSWSNFAKTGDPNGGTLPVWPAFDGETQPTMILSGNSHVENAPYHAEYLAAVDFLKAFNVFDALK